MADKVTLRISGNVMDVSPDGKSALPLQIRNILEPNLRYRHIRLLRGQDAYDFSGKRRPIQTVILALYTYDKYDRLVCGAGFQTRVEQALKEAGYETTVEYLNSPHPRTDRFVQDWVNVVNNFTFRPRQEEALVTIASNSRCIIDAPTGFGKTFLYSAISLLHPNAKILIVTKRKDLMQGIKLNLSKYLPNIGCVDGSTYRPSRITVCTAGSLHKIDPNEVDILIGEEVHELAAPSYISQIARFDNCRMYGFSATPDGRMDNADVRLEGLFGPVKFRMSYQEAVQLGLVVPIQVMWLDVLMNDNPAAGKEDVPRIRHGIWRNRERNTVIAAAARQFDADEQVLIMVTTFEHAVYLRQLLPEFTLCYAERPGDDSFERFKAKGMLPADEPAMTSQRRQMLRQQFERGELKKVIATDVWSTGVNFTGLSVLIRADARSSEIMDSQIPGRVCRLNENKPIGLVIDCLDQFDARFREAARKRRRNYATKGWEQNLPSIGRPDLLPTRDQP